MNQDKQELIKQLENLIAYIEDDNVEVTDATLNINMGTELMGYYYQTGQMDITLNLGLYNFKVRKAGIEEYNQAMECH